MPFGTDNLCVWHVPRSGGVWLRNNMQRAGIDVRELGRSVHETCYQYRGHHNFHAVLVREPVNWYCSIVLWMREYGIRAPLIEWFPGVEGRDLEDMNRFLCRHVGCYTHLLENWAPPYAMRIRLENISQESLTWIKASGTEIPNEVSFKNPPENTSNYLHPSVQDEVREMVSRTERV